jgi:exosome complex RNA-binding protein Rrp4
MKRWKVDVNGRQDAVLLLSSVSLPGGVQVNIQHVAWNRVILTLFVTHHDSDVKPNQTNFKCVNSSPKEMCWW